ncbi:MAG: extracellular solute-binding protein [Bacilli bacterium]|nr:extracellular solute-binding protein [Bacilli bacterium]MBN2877864.1 extracellular solute-binding protein [Bacilli bacterium]
MKRLWQRTNKKHLVIGILIILLLFVVVSVNLNTDIDYIAIDNQAVTLAKYDPDSYSVVSDAWTKVRDASTLIVTADEMDAASESGIPYDYNGDVLHLSEGDSITFNVNILEAGAYQIVIDQLDISSSILPNEISLAINSQIPYTESDVIKLTTFWQFENSDFTLDRYGNEILPNSMKTMEWNHNYLYDSTGLNGEPLLYDFIAGSNFITLRCVSGEMLLGSLTIQSVVETPSYEEYLAANPTAEMATQTIRIGAENIALKSNPSISLTSERDPSATSYDTKYTRLNAIDGSSFDTGNDTVVYTVTVEEDGYYYLGFKYKQDYLMQMPVFREIAIDGTVPFSDLQDYPFQFTAEYQNMILNNGTDNYQFYLTAGTHQLSLRVVLDPYRNAYENIVTIMDEINTLSLQIKRLTGNTSDKYRTWKLIDYIPDIETRLDSWITVINDIYTELSLYSHQDNPGQLTNLNLALTRLEELRKDVDKIPTMMEMLSDGSSSTTQFLGWTIDGLLFNGLDIESIYFSGDGDLPKPQANAWVRTTESIKRFFLSFTADEYAVKNTEEGVVEVWVNHPRQYIEIMQEMIDNEFTPITGIKIRLSIMPDENKLILANSTKYSPDVALGVNYWIPYEFAIRGAAADLRQFSGFEDMVQNYAIGAMVPYVFEEGVYGIPETQNFWVTFYRTDIFDALGLDVPNTWEEVIDILPELQRYGMNFYEPLAMFKGFKPFVATIPFIYQFGGTLYASDGMSTVINSEESLRGIELMTDLFTVYNLPEEITNFYNHFRYGDLPIGISDLSTYLQLTIAAPEIAGKWAIALHPGVENTQGEVERWAATGAQSAMILSKSQYQEESWDFLEWWMSTTVQTNFAQRLQTTYGTSYLWNTANLEAFAQLPLPSDDIDVILNQWDYALEATRIPGYYMVEREISNAWNTIVFDDANPRITLDEAVRTANREILYKMEEFGYVQNGVMVMPYNVATIDNISQWLKEYDTND